MGSDSDWPTMKAAAEALKEFGIASEARVISAHRDPHGLEEYVATVPVATVAVGAGRNAGILAAQILAVGDVRLQSELKQFKVRLTEESRAKNKTLTNA